MRRRDRKYDVFKIAWSIVKTNQDILEEQCIRNDDGELVVSDHKKLLYIEFAMG